MSDKSKNQEELDALLAMGATTGTESDIKDLDIENETDKQNGITSAKKGRGRPKTGAKHQTKTVSLNEDTTNRYDRLFKSDGVNLSAALRAGLYALEALPDEERSKIYTQLEIKNSL